MWPLRSSFVPPPLPLHGAHVGSDEPCLSAGPVPLGAAAQRGRGPLAMLAAVPAGCAAVRAFRALRRPWRRRRGLSRVQRRARQCNGFSWEEFGRHAHEIKIYLPIASDVTPRDVAFSYADGWLRLGLESHAPVVEGELFGDVDAEEQDWMIDTHEGVRSVVVTLTKVNPRLSWDELFKGVPSSSSTTQPEPSADPKTDYDVLEQMERIEFLLKQKRLEEAQEMLQVMCAGHSDIIEGRIELADVAGKGRGYVAARGIKKGEVVLYDSSFCVAPCGKDQWMSLGQQCMQKSDSQTFKDDLMSLSPAPGGEAGLLGILKNNVFECTRDPGFVALFIAAARFNHSCRPNAFIDSSRSQAMVRALRDITPGEEVCVSYVPVASQMERRRESLSQWGFLCHCDRCEAEAASDPQLAVFCQCGGWDFAAQEGAPQAQTCGECGASFDREESLRTLAEVREANEFAESAEGKQADPQALVRKLGPLTVLLEHGASPSTAAPKRHHESVRLLRNLAEAHAAAAEAIKEPLRSASQGASLEYRRRYLHAYEANHGRTGQRDGEYLSALYKMTCRVELKDPEERKEWEGKLASFCKTQFGQEDLPSGLKPGAPPR